MRKILHFTGPKIWIVDLSDALIADDGIQTIPCLPSILMQCPCAYILDFVVGVGQLFRLLVSAYIDFCATCPRLISGNSSQRWRYGYWLLSLPGLAPRARLGRFLRSSRKSALVHTDTRGLPEIIVLQ